MHPVRYTKRSFTTSLVKTESTAVGVPTRPRSAAGRAKDPSGLMKREKARRSLIGPWRTRASNNGQGPAELEGCRPTVREPGAPLTTSRTVL